MPSQVASEQHKLEASIDEDERRRQRELQEAREHIRRVNRIIEDRQRRPLDAHSRGSS